MELRVGEDVVVEEVVVGLPNGFVGFDSTVGLGFVMAEDVAKTDDDGGPVFSVVVVVTGLDTGFEVDAGILVGGFGLAIVVDGFEVVVGLVGLTFCAGLVVAMVVNFWTVTVSVLLDVGGVASVDEKETVVVAKVGRCLTDVRRGLIVVEFTNGFGEVEEGLFVCVLGFFVLTIVGLFVLLLITGFLVLVIGFLVVAWVMGLAVVEFRGGNLVDGTILWVVVATIFDVVDSVVDDKKGLDVVAFNAGLWTVVEWIGLWTVDESIGFLVTGLVVWANVCAREDAGALVTTSMVVGLWVIDEVNDDLLVVVVAISMIVLDGFCAVGTVLLVILGGLFVLESPFDEFSTVWKVDNRTGFVVVSMLVITGFLVTSFVVSFTVVDCVPTLCAACVVIVS